MDDIQGILGILKEGFFDPQADQPHKIPDVPGNYIFCLREPSTLPSIRIDPIFTRFDGMNVIYTGISRDSLRSRDYRKHFTGNNAGRSTLRKSVGVMFGYTQIPRDKDANTGKTKFSEIDERKLTDWMLANLVMFYLPRSNPEGLEKLLIDYFNPPLNLKSNDSPVNREFRRRISELRGNRG